MFNIEKLYTDGYHMALLYKEYKLSNITEDTRTYYGLDFKW